MRKSSSNQKRIDLRSLFLLEYPHLSQTTSHLFLRAGWRNHTAEDGSKLSKHVEVYGPWRDNGHTYQSAKSAKAKNPSNTVLAIERTGVHRVVVGFRICELEYCT
jgi:hypothetical protein